MKLLVAQSYPMLGDSPPAMQEIRVRSLGWEDALEKGTATHSSILAWRIPWTEPIRLLYPRDFPGKNTGLAFPSPGHLPNPEIKPSSSALQADCLSLSHHRNPNGPLGVVRLCSSTESFR